MYIPNRVPPIPKLFYNMPCVLFLKTGKPNRYGETNLEELSLMCKFTQKTKRILTEERSIVTIEGTALIDGNAELKGIVGSDFVVFDTRYTVYTCKGIKNPDGTIHHWKLELI